MAEPQQFAVKWSGKEYVVSVEVDKTIGDLKHALEEKTQVLSKRQKLTGLPKLAAGDETRIGDLKLKQPQKLMSTDSSAV